MGMIYTDYVFSVSEDEIVFDEELDGDKFLNLHDIEQDTLYSLSSIDGVLCFTKIYEEDDDEPDEFPEEDYEDSNNIIAFNRSAHWPYVRMG